MYAHNLRNTRSKKISRPIPEPIKKESISPPSESTIAHDLIDRLKQLNKESINDNQQPEEIPKETNEDHSKKINEIRIRRSQSIDVLKKRTILPPIPEKSLTQREITIKSSSSTYPMTTVRRRMSQTVLSRTPVIKPPPIQPKPIKPYLKRKETNQK